MVETILKKIIIKRVEKNLSQYYMAEQLKITQGYYSKIENGKKMPNLKTVLDIAIILNVHPTELFPEPKTHNS
ncbi:helix-turn-helix transcriptional regulator [Flavobacterium terrisoli]|uniref:helix-turn-helix transcriptional regulator n=1 Tax=Flavobacterium terrisoli TaxID=3242195 RepID=UPI00254352FD|nr:helix-turn-helix transcriptional regulator [Flavobacterium buctense]